VTTPGPLNDVSNRFKVIHLRFQPSQPRTLGWSWDARPAHR